MIGTRPFVRALAIALGPLLAPLSAQELPLSGVSGLDFVYASSPSGTSRLYGINIFRSTSPFPIGPAVNGVPSRWAHRRRTLGGLETQIGSPERGVFITAMGDAPGNAGLHVVDLRTGGAVLAFATGGNPAGYDLSFDKTRHMAFSAEDDGQGHTLLRGYSYGANATLTPLNPPTLAIPGAPSAYVNRIGIDVAAGELHVPTSTGVQVVFYGTTVPNLTPGVFVSTSPAAPATNPIAFERSGARTWTLGTTTFDQSMPPRPVTAGFVSWSATGSIDIGTFGSVPSAPAKDFVPAVGTEELALVGNGTDTYVYYLLREPPPGTFFVKPSAVGVVRFLGTSAPVVDRILMPDEVGEPFAIPAVSGGRIAFESSMGPPFSFTPPGGAELISIIYSPLDPLGAGTLNGLLGVPDPLGGRISTKGMDRPLWSEDGTRVFAATSHFPGAPNPGMPGLEVLDVPLNQPLDAFSAPHTVVANTTSPNQSIVFPTSFRPRIPSAAGALAGLSFFGNVFHQGIASLTAAGFGELGQLQLDPNGFVQSPFVPDFPSILQASFLDATGSTTPIPPNFGARRTTFNFTPARGLEGLVMSAAIDDGVYVQLSGSNFLAALGLQLELPPVRVALPTGWITTSEILSY